MGAVSRSERPAGCHSSVLPFDRASVTNPRILVAIVSLLASASEACVVSPHGPSAATTRDGVPGRDRAYVAVLSGEMPGAPCDVSRHSWVVANVRGPSGAFRHRRYEWLGDARATDSNNPFDDFGIGDVAFHGVVVDEEPSKLVEMVMCLSARRPRGSCRPRAS